MVSSESRPPAFERVEKRINWPHFQKNKPFVIEERLKAPGSPRRIETDMNPDTIIGCKQGEASYDLVMIRL
jgi:hypothetical protein